MARQLRCAPVCGIAALSLLCANSAVAQSVYLQEARPETLTGLPPSEPDAGGANVPNLGMLALRKLVQQFGGHPPSSAINMLPGTVPHTAGAPVGYVLDQPPIYLPDFAPPGTPIEEVWARTELLDEDYPEPFFFSNSDPSGSLDRTALDANGDPIHFNLHWPQAKPESFWLDDEGLDPAAPTDDLEQILNEIITTGSQTRVQEGLDILLGENVSGALSSKAYLGFPMLRHKGAVDNQSYDPKTRNIDVTQLWYGTEIVSDCQMLKVPAHGPYTITWHLRGLGDPGPDRSLAFPIDEFSSMPMKKTSNTGFWTANSWIWKWFDEVEYKDGRRYALETLFDLHTGSSSAPSYSQLNPSDPRYWLHVDRRFDFGSYVGEGDLFNFLPWTTSDLDLSGTIGGFLADGTDTGLPYEATTNPDAQFNQYGNNEYAVPQIDWSQGPYHIPYFGYDSSFTTVRKGQGIDVTIRYGEGEMQAGLYTWGWREHPPRINWIETYSKGQMLPSGAPKDWRFGHKWDAVADLGLDAIGDFAPEKRILVALADYQASAGSGADIAAFAAEVEGLMVHVRDRRGLPPTPGLTGFPNPAADANLLFTNLDIYGDRDLMAATGSGSWKEGDVITLTIHNDDNVERYFRSVDFGTTDYQYVGTDMGLFDWKPVYGFPQIAASAWGNTVLKPFPFDAQTRPQSYWLDTAAGAQGNPFHVDPLFEELDRFWPAGERDLSHQYSLLEGFSGPGFTSETTDPFSVWAMEHLSSSTPGDSDIWSYSYGKPIAPGATVTLNVEMPRAAALNNGAMYLFDPQFHSGAIFTMHPRAEQVPEELGQ